MRIILILSAAIGTLGANCLEPIACTAVVLPGVVVQVVNADTGAAVTNATVTLVEGDYTESLLGYEGSHRGAEERPGTYTLTVMADGYETATVSNLVVTADVCHVITVYRDIELQPIQ